MIDEFEEVLLHAVDYLLVLVIFAADVFLVGRTEVQRVYL